MPGDQPSGGKREGDVVEGRETEAVAVAAQRAASPLVPGGGLDHPGGGGDRVHWRAPRRRGGMGRRTRSQDAAARGTAPHRSRAGGGRRTRGQGQYTHPRRGPVDRSRRHSAQWPSAGQKPHGTRSARLGVDGPGRGDDLRAAQPGHRTLRCLGGRSRRHSEPQFRVACRSPAHPDAIRTAPQCAVGPGMGPSSPTVESQERLSGRGRRPSGPVPGPSGPSSRAGPAQGCRRQDVRPARRPPRVARCAAPHPRSQDIMRAAYYAGPRPLPLV
jgi:hypothetical protein